MTHAQRRSTPVPAVACQLRACVCDLMQRATAKTRGTVACLMVIKMTIDNRHADLACACRAISCDDELRCACGGHHRGPCSHGVSQQYSTESLVPGIGELRLRVRARKGGFANMRSHHAAVSFVVALLVLSAASPTSAGRHILHCSSLSVNNATGLEEGAKCRDVHDGVCGSVKLAGTVRVNMDGSGIVYMDSDELDADGATCGQYLTSSSCIASGFDTVCTGMCGVECIAG